MAPYILGINGSPHQHGATIQLLKAVLAGAEAAGAETEIVDLYYQHIEPSLGLYSVNPDLEVIENMPDDDMRRLYPKIQRAIGMVFATPNYWSFMSGPMKIFLDRLTPLENDGYQLTGKIAVCIAASKENQGGTELAALSILMTVVQMGFMVPPFGTLWYPGNIQQARGEIQKQWAMADASQVGKNIVMLAARTANIEWFPA